MKKTVLFVLLILIAGIGAAYSQEDSNTKGNPYGDLDSGLSATTDTAASTDTIASDANATGDSENLEEKSDSKKKMADQDEEEEEEEEDNN